MRTASPVKKYLLIVLIVLAALILLYSLFCLIAPRFFYPDFFGHAEKAASIPYLTEGFIPQGVTTADDGTLLVCGYMPGGKASRIIRTGDKPVRIFLERENGEVYDGHAGGMTAAGEYIYISNASKIFVLNTADVLNAKDGDSVRFIGHFDVPCRASFCASSNGMLYVGEFHAAGYDTNDSHRFTTADGEYAAMVFGFPLSAEAGRFGVIEEPAFCYAVCDKVQGFTAMPEGYAVLSCSYGLADSELKFYDLKGDPDSTFKNANMDIPLYLLDSKREKSVVRAPHMSEDIEYREGALLIAFEAGAMKYGAGILPFSIRSVMRYRFAGIE